MEVGNLKVTIGADTQQFEKGMSVAEDGLLKFDKSVQQLQDQLKRFQGYLKSATDTTSVARLNRAIEVTKGRIDDIGKFKGAGLDKVQTSANQATVAMSNLGRVVQDAPYGFMGIANNINPLLESFQRLKVETGSTKMALQSLGSQLFSGAGLGLAVSFATAILAKYGDQFFTTSKKVQEAKERLDDYRKSVDSVYSSVAKEATEVQSLIAVLNSETATRQRKLDTLAELKRINPEIFGQLKLEGDTVKGLDAAYQTYISNLSTVIRVKMLQLKLEDTTKRILERTGAALTKSEQEVVDVLKEGINARRQQIKDGRDPYWEKQQKEQKNLNRLYDDQADLIKQITELQKGVKVPKPTQPKAKTYASSEEVPKYTGTKGEMDFTVGTGSFLHMREFRAEVIKTIDTLKQLPRTFNIIGIAGLKNFDDIRAKFAAFEGAVKSAMQSFQENLASGIGESIGNAITGDGGLKEVFAGMFSVFGDMLQQLGKAMIGYAISLKAIKTAFKTLNPLVALTAGTAAIALGAIVKNSVGRIPKFAKGGMVTGPTLSMLGDNASGKEAIIPFERMGEFMQGIGGGAKNVQVEVIGTISNDVIRLANARGASSYNRRF